MSTVVVSLGDMIAAAAAKKAVTVSAAAKPASVVSEPTANSAKMFFLALRSAGTVINSEGRKVSDPGMVREHEVKAIQEFCGYDMTGPHGSQLDAARMMAQRLLARKETKVIPYTRCSVSAGNGTVFGMPDNITKHRAQLEAMVRQTIEDKCLAYAGNDRKKCATLDSQLSELRMRLAQLG